MQQIDEIEDEDLGPGKSRMTNSQMHVSQHFLIKPYKSNSSASSTVYLFVFFATLFLIMGLVLLDINQNIVEIAQEYGQKCENQSECTVTFNLDQSMQPPIYFFYELDNFHQNHRRYIKSKNPKQLMGQSITFKEANETCYPLVTNAQMGKQFSWKNVPLKPDDIANPCGIIAKSLFDDTYQLFDSKQNPIPIDESKVAWPEDQGTKFKKAPDSEQSQWINPENAHFIVWMRTAGVAHFRKFWGGISQELPAGQYTVKIANSIININIDYDVEKFDGKKYFVMSTSGPFGGKNIFVQNCFFFLSALCFSIAIFFKIKINTSGGTFGQMKKQN